ncbi:hypothetical protein WA1_08445 [Scytonema hofmannii PCC 7110]|uniref:DUF6575 domain-containing protein n=1 Tax=Scytonema hofmannii PCC 7110 TaxID=128403 RepID=A0A139WRZ8_9CYAN|nr:hypothetical protein WA1_08445 [Scytonema hofmannii PCC 7110]
MGNFSPFKGLPNKKKGTVELRDVFINSEDFFVYQIEIVHEDNSKIDIRTIYCDEIVDEYLPDTGQIIQY